MGSAAAEVADMGLDLKLCAMRTVVGFVKAASTESCDGGMAARLEESIKSLEEEKRKIEAFKRELPLCMLLLAEVIEGLKKEIEQCCSGSFGHVLEEFIPIKSKVEEEERVKEETACQDKMNWMISAQLWTDNYSENNDDDKNHEKDGGSRGRQGKENLLLEFKGLSAFASTSKEEEKPAAALSDLSLLSPAAKTSPGLVTSVADHHRVGVGVGVGGSGYRSVGNAAESSLATVGGHLGLQSQHQPPRKGRRCWSQELHRRFVLSIQQLGGAQVATPKQIREVMNVDGLTNDEVKSHLQKYRLHTRRVPNASAAASRPVVVGGLWVPQEQCTSSSQHSVSPSSSPQSPLQLPGSARALSVTAGDSSEEDGKSDGYSWK